MRAVKKINNNVAICIDGTGNQLVAFGKGIGFPAMPYEITDLKQIDQTFYNISSNYVDMINDLPEDIITFTARILDDIRTVLPYELMPNLILTLADHIAFCLERHRRNLYVRMPLLYEIAQTYPLELKLSQYILRELEKKSMCISIRGKPLELQSVLSTRDLMPNSRHQASKTSTRSKSTICSRRSRGSLSGSSTSPVIEPRLDMQDSRRICSIYLNA